MTEFQFFLKYPLHWLQIETVYRFKQLGYLIRPYDMLKDRRRWFWQRRGYCFWSSG